MVQITQTKVSQLSPDASIASEPTVTNTSSNINDSADNNNNNNNTTTEFLQQYELVSQEILTVTESCLKQIEVLIQKQPQTGHYLRVYVDAGGCSGFEYKFELCHDDLEDDDIVVATKRDGATRLVVDETSLNFLRGSTIDYVREMIRSSFVVSHNPQSESACGCGSSFAVKNFGSNPALD